MLAIFNNGYTGKFDLWILEKIVNSSSKLIKDWLNKEDEFLKENITENSVVLDVGIGYGRNVETVASRAKKLVGIDKSTLLFKEAKKITKKYPNVELFCEDASEMHFQNDSFDFVICMGNTFGDFAENKLKILREMKRVCKKGGKIFISVYSENAIDYRIKEYERIGIKISRIRDGEILTSEGLELEQFTKEKLKKNLYWAGLKVKVKKLNKISYICIANK